MVQGNPGGDPKPERNQAGREGDMAKARFSGTVKLDTGDLSDYIAPAQNCVVGKEGNKEEKQDHGVHRHVEKEAKPVKVTLHDCLACRCVIV